MDILLYQSPLEGRGWVFNTDNNRWEMLFKGYDEEYQSELEDWLMDQLNEDVLTNWGYDIL